MAATGPSLEALKPPPMDAATFFKSTEGRFKRPLAKVPAVKDFPRLAPRITVEVYEQPNKAPFVSAPLQKRAAATKSAATAQQQQQQPQQQQTPAIQGDPTEVKSVNEIRRVALLLTQHLQPTELDTLRSYFGNLTGAQYVGIDVSGKVLRELLRADDGVVPRLMKAVNQSFVSVGVQYMMELVMDRVGAPVRDTHGPQGWQVRLELWPRWVRVFHKRRDSGASTTHTPGDWWVEYEVAATFDRALTVLYAVRLRITKLWFASTVDPLFVQRVKTALCNGNMILF